MTLFTRTGQLITNQVETFDGDQSAGPWSELSVPGSPAGDQGGHTMKTRTAASTPRSAGITLTEILISILILGVGLVSLATLFPIGLLRSAKPSARRGRPTSSSRPRPTWSLEGCSTATRLSPPIC